MKGDRFQTQWAGQFGVAHEMTRRSYLVSFTMGNAPAIDLLCKSPNDTTFSLQVKSLKAKNYWIYQEKLLNPNPDLYFVFALVPSDTNQPPTYFVLNNGQFQRVVAEQKEIDKERVKKRGKPYASFSPGFSYLTLDKEEFRNNWGNLPK